MIIGDTRRDLGRPPQDGMNRSEEFWNAEERPTGSLEESCFENWGEPLSVGRTA